MPEEEGGYLSGVAPALKTSGNAGNAVFRARNFHFLKDDKNFNTSEGFNAPQSIYNDFVNGRLAPEFHYNTIPGSLNTKGFYRNDNGKKVYAVIRDAYDPSLREKRVVEIGPDGLNLTGQEYVSQYFYGDRGDEFMNDKNTIAFPRPQIDRTRLVKAKADGRMDYDKALYARQLMNGLKQTMIRHGVTDRYLKKKFGFADGWDSFGGDVLDELRHSEDGNILAGLADFTGIPLMTIQSPRGKNVNEDPDRLHQKRYDDYFDDYDSLSQFMKNNYGDAAYSDGYTETPVKLFANGGYLYMRKNNLSTPTLKSADGVTMGKPMRLEELQKLREDWEQNAQSSDETNAQSSDSATTPPSDKTTTQLPDNSDGLSDDDIDNLALQTLRGVYGNGKKRKEALGDAYAAVQKRVNEMLKEMQAAKEAKKAAKEAARNRKAWDETPEEYKQQLTPKKYNPRSYDLTTDDLRLHERAARQAQQERSLDDNPHSRIRDNGETKRLIGGTNNYDIYL